MMTPYNEAWIQVRDEWQTSNDALKNKFVLAQQIDKVLTNRFAPGRWHRTMKVRDRINMKSDLWVKHATLEGLKVGKITLLDKEF